MRYSFNERLAKKLGLDKKEITILKKLNSPQKIQDFLRALPGNFEKKSETLMSPRLVLQHKICHCMEGALFAALVLWLHGREPLLVDIKAKSNDLDHVITVFKENGYWGAISKTNHYQCRYRDPIYKNVRELLMSYFHEYFLAKTGQKTLLSYSKPYNLKSLKDISWAISPKPLWHISKILDTISHLPFILNKKVLLRRADKFEQKIARIPEYP